MRDGMARSINKIQNAITIMRPDLDPINSIGDLWPLLNANQPTKMMPTKQGQEQRRLLIDVGFQGNFTLVTVSAAILIFNALLIYGLVFHETFRYTHFSFGNALGIAVVEIAVVALAVEYSLRTSKRLAGPIHGVNRVVRSLAEGDFTVRIAPRKREFFKNRLEEINASLDVLEQQMVDLQTELQEAQRELGAVDSPHPNWNALQRRIMALKARPREGRSKTAATAGVADDALDRGQESCGPAAPV